MRNLMNICKMLPILVLMLGSCKTKDPDPENTAVTMKDLTDYYVVVEHKTGGNKLLVLYFKEEGNVIKAHAHLQGQLRISEGTLQNSTFTLDYNSDGKSMYTFDIEKAADGSLKLTGYDFVYNGEGDQLGYAVMAKKSDALAFENSSFKIASESFKLIKNADSETLWWYGTSYNFYRLENVGFKSNNDQFLAAAVPSWRGIGTPVMLVEEGDKVYIAHKE